MKFICLGGEGMKYCICEKSDTTIIILTVMDKGKTMEFC